mmetsp:Transcript_36041/g.55368  ORF Transcript_36041/g.55368 Transcript_36041/m.55368 type:complete len:108 (-) Transcript_36041:121-444(-)
MDPYHEDVPYFDSSTIAQEEKAEYPNVTRLDGCNEQAHVRFLNGCPEAFPSRGRCKLTPNGSEDLHPNKAVEEDYTKFTPYRVGRLPSLFHRVANKMHHCALRLEKI